MATHEPPCETWQAHVAVALDAGEADRPADFLDRLDQEREEEERYAEPRGDNPWDSAYAGIR